MRSTSRVLHGSSCGMISEIDSMNEGPDGNDFSQEQDVKSNSGPILQVSSCSDGTTIHEASTHTAAQEAMDQHGSMLL